MTAPHGKHLIGGTPTAETDARFRAVAPAIGESIDPGIAEATATEVDRTMALAADAAEVLRNVPAQRRATLLSTIAEGLERTADAIVERAMLESGLPEARLRGELGRTTAQLRMFERLVAEGSWVDARIDRGDPTRTPLPKPDIRRMLVPLGPVVVFGASNFPLAFSVAGGDTASALAAGCPVVVKGHPAHPGTSELVGSVIAAAVNELDLPAGTFALLQGREHDVGTALVRHPATRAVGFTGSLKGGRALYDAAAAREVPIPVFAEMGSVNPVFVLPGALRERPEAIAEGLHASFTLGVGQFCTNPGIVVLPPGEGNERFRERLAELTRTTEPGTMLYGGIRDAFEAGIERLGAVSGVDVVERSARPGDPASTEAGAIVLEVDAETFLAHDDLSEEVFGPSTLLVAASSKVEVHAVARSLEGHLTATLIARPEEIDEHSGLASTLASKVGRLIVNGYPTGVEVCSAMQHGGPYPATTDARFTSVGTAAILRFARPLAYQDAPPALLPEELRDANPRGIVRLVDDEYTRDPL